MRCPWIAPYCSCQRSSQAVCDVARAVHAVGLTPDPGAMVLSQRLTEPSRNNSGGPMIRRALLATFLVCFTTAAVRAADQTVLGSSFIVRNPSTATKQKISVKAKEKATDNTIVGDPVANGATVVITANGGNSTEQTFTLPAGPNPATSKQFWSGDAV